ncbi:uncharacterized protein LOC143008805 [Genypterus blacodes]|uniref:uncharacterized protein LOC143008805 n=1 Tax=Genypterus blacodes TaxID=154954 RepID=UPI003F75A0D9
MAAVHPSESPLPEKSPAEGVETPSGRTDASPAACSSTRARAITRSGGTQSPGREHGAAAGSDGGCVSRLSGARVEPGAGADTATNKSPEEPSAKRRTGRGTGASRGKRRGYDSSEGDDEEEKTREEEEAECDLSDVMEQAEDTHEDMPEASAISDTDAQEMSDHEEGDEQAGEADGLEEMEEDDERADGGEEADSPSKSRKAILQCKDCGERFSRRETFNLHRHFHAHGDELTQLTCKECDLTFEHRSSLIKHRNEHKGKEEPVLTQKMDVGVMAEGAFKCAECEKFFSTVKKLREHNCNNVPEKPYHCPLCRQEFQHKVAVTAHMKYHSLGNIFPCQECYRIFPDSVTLRDHQRCHATLKPYECPECGMVFKHYSVMEDHRRKHTENMPCHVCHICGKSFKYSSLLHQHQYLHTGQKPFSCPECGKTFAFAQNMKAHCRQHRLRETNSLSSADQPSKQPPVCAPEAVRRPGKENTNESEEQKRTLSCPVCQQSHNTPASLRAHMLVHEAEHETVDRTINAQSEEINKDWEKGHACPHCPSIYRDAAGYRHHLIRAHSHYIRKSMVAPINQLAPLSSDNVQGKRRSDGTSVKSYKCSECGKVFRHRSVLELHMRIHSKERPYQCKVCKKGFRFSSYLQQHMIIHTGKKPYKCPDCGKEFGFLQNMKTHQKLHQEKPFRCSSCRKGYSDEIQLQHHMLSHNGEKPHKCHLCDKSFGLAYLLRDHLNTHTGERPHRCNECQKSFSWFSSLLVHQKIHARKRQSFSQHTSLLLTSRTRGRGSKMKRGGRPQWGWSRSGSGTASSQLHPVYSVSSLRDVEVQVRAAQSLSTTPSSLMEVQGREQKESGVPELHHPVQWRVDDGELMPVPSSQKTLLTPQFDDLSQPALHQHHQRGPGLADGPLTSQPGSISVHSLESAHLKEGAASGVGSLPQAVPNKPSPPAVGEIEQHRQPKPLYDISLPANYIDGAALWSIRPSVLAPSQNSSNKLGQDLQLLRRPSGAASTQMEPSAPPKEEESAAWDLSNHQGNVSTVSQPEKQRASGASTSAQIDQSSAKPISSLASHGVGSTLWDLQTPPGIPKNVSPGEKVGTNQQKQVSAGWASVQSQAATQKLPIAIQYEAGRGFTQGIATPVWSFQNNPVGPQTLIAGQLKPGSGQEQQKPMVTTTQIIINQPSPFFSHSLTPLTPIALPGAHPLHSVTVGALTRPPHPNIFFTPQAIMSERPHLTQTLSLPQLTPRTEPHKLGPRLPFPPERLLQCMICGCSLPRELDLQMHYLQHAQGEI